MGLERKHHIVLWLIAFLTFVVGDSITTVIGLSGGATEAHPTAQYILSRWGEVGMVVVKSSVLLTLYTLYWLFDRLTRWNIDDEASISVALLGLAITLWNVHVLVSV